MQTWAKVGLVFIALAVAAGMARGKPEVQIKCSAKDDSGECVVENKGSATGTFDADVILVCRDGEHVAHVSANVEAHNESPSVV